MGSGSGSIQTDRDKKLAIFAEDKFAHVMKAVDSIRPRPITQFFGRDIFLNSAEDFCGVAGERGEEEKDGSTEPARQPHGVGQGEQAAADEQVARIE